MTDIIAKRYKEVKVLWVMALLILGINEIITQKKVASAAAFSCENSAVLSANRKAMRCVK